MDSGDLIRTPEQAIVAFEKLTSLRVVIHDIAGTIWPFLSPERLQHRAPACMAVKSTHDWACMDFELRRLRRELPGQPEGRVHCCHAGLIEWVVPIYAEDTARNGALAWILFAGQRRPAGNWRHLHKDSRTSHLDKAGTWDVSAIAEDDATCILEALRQLRARLVEWRQAASSLLASDAERTPAPGLPAGMQDADTQRLVLRRVQVERFILQRHTGRASVGDLARELKLSESRTIHLVRELFGISYAKLLTEMRLRTAASLLRNSELGILDVGLSSGFSDLSNFHRRFRKRFGLSPLRYRRHPGATV
ncbi:hypothetical protein DB346_22920 [Verrucomicrobia bacterium LW23]|nr:hypothetical protein DB346_22920 [Verrucomicrobia bacterium LW23]